MAVSSLAVSLSSHARRAPRGFAGAAGGAPLWRARAGGGDWPAAPCATDADCAGDATCDAGAGACVPTGDTTDTGNAPPDPPPTDGPWADPACYPGSLAPTSTQDRLDEPRSCLYDNRFAGPDCKLYIGSAWDATARDGDCGAGFVEENAELRDDCCPLERNGEAAVGGCRVGAGTADEIFVLSYGADPSALETACTSFQGGVWEPAGSDTGAAEPTYPASPAAFAALASSDDRVQVTNADCTDLACLETLVERGETFDFVPQGTVVAGVALYPGGGVDPRAYAVLARALAERGVYVAIVPMKNFLAISGVGRADDVQAAHPEIDDWFVVGHSLGGAMAIANALGDGGDDKAGFILWAAVPGSEADYSAGARPVLSVWATRDTSNTPADVEDNRPYLPASTTYVAIEGGIHHYYGDYLDFETDGDAISREQQQAAILDATLAFIADVVAD